MAEPDDSDRDDDDDCDIFIPYQDWNDDRDDGQHDRLQQLRLPRDGDGSRVGSLSFYQELPPRVDADYRGPGVFHRAEPEPPPFPPVHTPQGVMTRLIEWWPDLSALLAHDWTALETKPFIVGGAIVSAIRGLARPNDLDIVFVCARLDKDAAERVLAICDGLLPPRCGISLNRILFGSIEQAVMQAGDMGCNGVGLTLVGELYFTDTALYSLRTNVIVCDLYFFSHSFAWRLYHYAQEKKFSILFPRRRDFPRALLPLQFRGSQLVGCAELPPPGYDTEVWATGFQRSVGGTDHPWLRLAERGHLLIRELPLQIQLHIMNMVSPGLDISFMFYTDHIVPRVMEELRFFIRFFERFDVPRDLQITILRLSFPTVAAFLAAGQNLID